MRVLLIDNYDSFTYNLAQAFAAEGAEVLVYRHDAIDRRRAVALAPTHLVISPGPGRPEDAGISGELMLHFMGRIPVLGVCLGCQLLGMLHGARVVHAPRPIHGKASPIHHDGRTVFRGLPDPVPMARYHSLVVEPVSLPPSIERSAWTADGLLMGLRHRPSGAEGVQFHPESVLSPAGTWLLRNFLA